MRQFLDEVRGGCGDRGIDYLLLRTDQPLADVLAHYLHARERLQALDYTRTRIGIPLHCDRPMNTLTFLNSPLLWGLALAAIPLLIHLLYRRQYRRIDWAPMHYLKLSIQRNRRRVRLEQLLLLLLRTCDRAAVVLSRRPAGDARRGPVAAGGAAAGAPTASWCSTIRSSMGYTEQGKTALARGQEVLADLLSTFGAKDRLTLRAGLAARSSRCCAKSSWKTSTRSCSWCATCRPTEVFAAWEPILQAIDDLIAGGSYPLHEVTLITDLRRAGWEGRLAELGNRWTGEHVRLRVFDVGIAADRKRRAGELASRSIAWRWSARRRASKPKSATTRSANCPAWKPISSSTASRAWCACRAWRPAKRCAAAGRRRSRSRARTTWRSSCQATRWRATTRAGPSSRCSRAIDMLLVDGEPSTEPLGGETDFLALALSLSGDTAEPFRVEVVTDAEWAASPPARSRPAGAGQRAAGQRRTGRVDRATGVRRAWDSMIFVGDQVDPDNYNQFLFKGGNGLLGAALESVSDAEFSGLLVEAGEGSPLAAVGQLTPRPSRGSRFASRTKCDCPTGDPPRRARVGALEQRGGGAGRRAKSLWPRAGAAVDHGRRPRLERLADRVELRAGGARGGPGHRPQHGQLARVHGRPGARSRLAGDARHHAAGDRGARRKGVEAAGSGR